jgi:hypothetical protein
MESGLSLYILVSRKGVNGYSEFKICLLFVFERRENESGTDTYGDDPETAEGVTVTCSRESERPKSLYCYPPRFSLSNCAS